MKKIILFLLTVLSANLSLAQDVITKKSGEDIKAKVLEVTTTEIKFKKSEMPDSPIFSLLKSDVLIVRYENGTKDIFNELPIKESPKVIVTEPKQKKIPKDNSIKGNRTSLGMKIGVNYSNLVKNDFYKPIITYHVGGFLEYKFSQIISIQPELQFSAQGFKIEGELRQNFDDTPTFFSTTTNLNYINVPILAKFNINKRLNIVAGPQVGCLVFAKNEGKNVISSYKTLDFGVNFGVGFSLNKVIIDLRYNIGLSDVSKYITSVKNSVFQLSVGYKFKS